MQSTSCKMSGWMASPTPWTWVWVSSGIWWWTGRPGVLRFMGLQKVRHDWASELNWTELTDHDLAIEQLPPFYLLLGGREETLDRKSFPLLISRMKCPRLMVMKETCPINFFQTLFAHYTLLNLPWGIILPDLKEGTLESS